jgi:translation initiation factor IF-1
MQIIALINQKGREEKLLPKKRIKVALESGQEN